MLHKTLVIGAAGSVGSELCRQLQKKNHVVALDQDETRIFELGEDLNIEPCVADIRDYSAIQAVFKKHKLDSVFHAAAYKHVSLMERFPEEAYKTNVIGLWNVATCAVYSDVRRFVFISSDKAVNPNGVMGHTKKIGERICLALSGDSKTEFVCVRFGNVLASRGSIIPIWQKQIERGGPVTITDPAMERYFMTIQEACELLIKAKDMGSGTYLLDMGKAMKIIDLASLMIKISGKKIKTKLIGKRTGEKLSEELFDSRTERLIKTKYKNIFKIIKQ